METHGPAHSAPKTACRAIWNWDSPPVVAESPVPAQLRRSGILRSLIGGAIATGLFALGFRIGAVVAGSMSVFVLVLAVSSPTRAYRNFESSVDRLGYGIGVLLSWLLLVPIFWGFFVPFRLLLRRGRRNSILFRTEGSSWVQRVNPDRATSVARPESCGE